MSSFRIRAHVHSIRERTVVIHEQDFVRQRLLGHGIHGELKSLQCLQNLLEYIIC